jgi:hypothetical protein
MHTRTEPMSPAKALGRYVEHLCAIRDGLGVQVHLAVTDDADTNGWVIRARVRPPIRVTATEAADGTWRVRAIRYRRSHTVSSVGNSPAALLTAIDVATDELVARVMKHTAGKELS